MFLLVSVRHVGAHPDGDQHCGVSILKSLLILWKHFFGYLVYEIFLWPESWRGSLHIYSLHLPDSGLYLINGLIYILIHFECRDAENQQSWPKKSSRRYAYYSKSFFSSFVYLFYFFVFSTFRVLGPGWFSAVPPFRHSTVTTLL